MTDIKKITYVLRNSDITGQALPLDLYGGEPIINTSEGILFFSGVSSTSPSWTPAGTGDNANFFEVGSNLYDLQLRHRLTKYDGINGIGLAGKFLSGTSEGFVLANISDIKGSGTGGSSTDTYVTGGTLNKNTGVATFNNNYGNTFNVTGFSTVYNDTFVTGGTHSNGTTVFRNNTGGTFSVTGYSTGASGTEVYVTGGTHSNGTTTFRNNTGGTFTVTGYSTVYQDVYVIGGSYADGVATFVNTTGGTFSVTGFNVGTGGSATDTYVTGGTLNQDTGVATFINNYGNIFTVEGFSTTYFDTYVTGGTYSNGTIVFTNNSGDTFDVTGLPTNFTETDTLQSVTDRGNTTTQDITANSFIKDGGLSSEFLKADGSVDNNTYLSSENDTLQSVTDRNPTTNNDITANSFIKIGGTSSEFLKADGSTDSNTYLTSENDTLQSVTDKGATTTNDITANSFIKQGGQPDEYLMADGTTSTGPAIGTDIYVTGGTYSDGIATFTNTSGGTFDVTGFSTGSGTDVYVTGGTYDNTTATTTLTQNDGSTINITGYTTGIFTQNIPVVLSGGKTLGRYSNGQTIPALGKTFQEVMIDIATEFIAPTFSSFSRAGMASIYDLGQNATIGSQTFSWGTTTSGNVSANTVTITQNYTSTVTLASNLANDGTELLTTSVAIFSNTPAQNQTIYTISAKNTQGATFSSSISASWRYRWYYGKFTNATITSSEITGLTSSNLVTTVTGTYYNFPATGGAQYAYLIIPTSLGQPSEFKDSTSGCFGNDIPVVNLGTVSITNQYGISTTYNQYRTSNPTSGALNIWLC